MCVKREHVCEARQGSGAIRLWYELPRRGGAGQGALTITTYISLIVSWVSRKRGHSLLLLFCYVMWYDNIYFYIILIAYKLIRVFYNKIIYNKVHTVEHGAEDPPSVSMSTAAYGSNAVFPPYFISDCVLIFPEQDMRCLALSGPRLQVRASILISLVRSTLPQTHRSGHDDIQNLFAFCLPLRSALFSKCLQFPSAQASHNAAKTYY